MASVCELIWETPFSCDLVVPRPSPHVRERGSGVLSGFLVKWGGVAPDLRAQIRLQNA